MAGYIQLTLKGGSEAKGGLFQSATDENTINFHSPKNKIFEQAKKIIEEKITSSNKQSISNMDELEKLSSLRDKGIVNEEEFLAKKKELLGL